jgi:hypothetical protein
MANKDDETPRSVGRREDKRVELVDPSVAAARKGSAPAATPRAPRSPEEMRLRPPSATEAVEWPEGLPPTARQEIVFDPAAVVGWQRKREEAEQRTAEGRAP